jgi:hypothetical protein
MVPAPENVAGSLKSVSCVPSGACTVVGASPVDPNGETISPTNFEFPLLERFDGTSLTVVRSAAPPPPPSAENGAGIKLVNVSCSSSSSCQALGWVYRVGGVSQFAEQWDGTTWRVEAYPAPKASLILATSLSCTADSKCTALGSAGGAYYMMRFDGTSWAAGPFVSVPRHARPNGLSCASALVCTAVGVGFGARYPIGGVRTPVAGAQALRLSGSIWRAEFISPRPPRGVALPADGLQAVSCPTTHWCVAVGDDWRGQLFVELPSPR